MDTSIVLSANSGSVANSNLYLASDGGVYELDNVIPVEQISFTVSVASNDVQLTRITASEFNNRGFDVERASSLNTRLSVGTLPLQVWDRIGFVIGTGTNVYSFTDKNLVSGNYCFRLKQIDLNGTYTYSNTIEVTVDIPVNYNLAQISVFLYPKQDTLQ